MWRFWTSFWPRFRPRFFQHQPYQKSKSLTCCYLVPRFSVTPYLVLIGKVDLKKKFPSTSYSFLFQIKAAAHMALKDLNKTPILLPQKLTYPRKMMVGRLFSFSNGTFSGGMLIFWGVCHSNSTFPILQMRHSSRFTFQPTPSKQCPGESKKYVCSLHWFQWGSLNHPKSHVSWNAYDLRHFGCILVPVPERSENE